MVINTKEDVKTVESMVTGSTFSQMELFTREIFTVDR
jgi:hypothetical protein